MIESRPSGFASDATGRRPPERSGAWGPRERRRKGVHADAGFGLAFAMLGAGLAIAAWRLPDGLAGVPGPGFFPMLVGAGLIVLGLALTAAGDTARPTYWERGWGAAPLRQAVAILALLAVYAALWEIVPFIWRTPVLLVALYRVLGEPWLRSLLIAVATTAVLAGVFDGLLRVRL